MSTVLLYAFFIFLLVLIAKPFGSYMTAVFNGGRTFMDPILRPLEKGIYKICGIKPDVEHNWQQYAINIILFSFVGLILLYLILRLQAHLPLNPQHFSALTPDLAFNTASSFVGNTNWQAYGGESTLSYFSQMLGLAVQNFLSGAVGICVAIALIRAFARKSETTIGNFWVDLTRSVLWILLPICIILALIYVASGVPQNFLSYIHATTLEGAGQVIPQGPVATQEAIKSLGTNGGGFFNVNSAHPYENPTAITNFLQAFSIFAIGAALTYTFGKMVGNTKQGWTILCAMLVLFIISISIMYNAEMHVNPHIAHDSVISEMGNMEGKEVRFGVSGSVLYNNTATAASDGGVNSALDSYMPIGGAMALINMILGEVIIGGVGAGLYSILMYVLLSVFIAGLMVGRTPEYLGKKIESAEMKMAVIAILVTPLCVLLFTAIACVLKTALASVSNPGPHGFTQILYAFASSANNNGSAFGGLNSNTLFYNITTGLAILFGRFLMIIPILAIAGSLVQKKRAPESSGTLATTGPLFAGLLIGVIILVAGLEFFPALSLGPIAEHLMMNANKLF